MPKPDFLRRRPGAGDAHTVHRQAVAAGGVSRPPSGRWLPQDLLEHLGHELAFCLFPTGRIGHPEAKEVDFAGRHVIRAARAVVDEAEEVTQCRLSEVERVERQRVRVLAGGHDGVLAGPVRRLDGSGSPMSR